jgi:dolichyl-phosphate-mannose-protein mannosyltransferase
VAIANDDFSPITRAEASWLFGAMVCAVVLRCSFIDHLAVEHFDEAVYASNLLYSSTAEGQFPGREFFAPPLLPSCIEWLTIGWMTVTGSDPPAWLPMFPALLSGVLAVPSVWWISRQWFSADSGIAAAWILALNEFHAVYSRTALTDVPLSLLMLWAVYWIWCAAQTGKVTDGIVAGLVTAVAWWTKYNGWLALGIGGGGLMLAAVLSRSPWLLQKKWAVQWALAVAVAFVVGFVPIWWDCQTVGGYGAVAANHAGYIAGWSSWPSHAYRQFDVTMRSYIGPVTIVGFSLPTLVMWLLSRTTVRLWIQPVRSKREPLPTPPRHRLNGVAFNAVVMLCFPSAVFLFGVIAGAVLAIFGVRRALRYQELQRLSALLMLLVWIVGLVVVTPLYQPYPRLLLPLLMASVCACGVFWRRGWMRFGDESWLAGRWWQVPLLTTALACSVMFVVPRLTWEPRNFYRHAAPVVADEWRRAPLASGDSAVVFVTAEPALYYWLRQTDAVCAYVAGPTVSDVVGVKPYFAAGPLFMWTPAMASQREQLATQFSLQKELITPNPPLSSLVLLDQDREAQRQLQERTPTVVWWGEPSDPAPRAAR